MNRHVGELEPAAQADGLGERDEVLLSQIRNNAPDKLGNTVEEIFWCGDNYTVYRTCKGVFVHFSDDHEEAKAQRRAFTEICPELCELRYLTAEMENRSAVFSLPIFRQRPHDSIFDHNIAQAIMLLMEGKACDAQDIADSALKLAVSRATNDNTIRYVRAALYSVLAILAVLTLWGWLDLAFGSKSLAGLLVAAGAGAIGALFSIITRLQSFELKPCQESNMNYLVSTMRILMGSVAAVFLVLLATTPLGVSIMGSRAPKTWVDMAVIGFIGGFAERLVQTLAQRTAGAMGDRGGTPVQVARSAQHAGQRARPAPSTFRRSAEEGPEGQVAG